ncbi:MAG: DUF3267 domain-containing protein [Ktedonobacterales bacterium]
MTNTPILIGRLLSTRRRQRLQYLLAEGGHLQQRDAVNLLEPAQLPEMARWSLALLIVSLVVFISLDVVARSRQPAGAAPVSSLTPVTVVLLIVANIVAYILMVPLHEALHAAVIVALGGRPSFGLQLPLAAYCTAPGQLFTRGGYIAVAIAPLLVLTILGVLAIWAFPYIAALFILGLAGNVSGAVGDLVAVIHVYRLPPTVLIADTQTGFIAYEVV